ncbi:MAG: hypothetical protein RLZZ458_2298 [Planctomycetota bacterium]|jgi:chromosome segregation ATPase
MIRFWKISTGVVTVLGGLAFAGITPTELSEYVSTASTMVEQRVEQTIPASVELQRLGVILKKLEQQVGSQKQAVATAKVDLEDAESEFQTQELACTRLKGEMQQLRQLTLSEDPACLQTVGYRGVSQQDIRRALAARLQSWKQATERCSALQVALQQRRAAFERLEVQFGEWQSRRDLLAQRLETLKIRQQTQTLSADTDTALFDDADLARATELADAVDRDLRIAEARTAIGLDPLDVIAEIPASADNTALESEVDQILNGAG